MLVVKVMHSVPRNKTNQSLKAEKEPRMFQEKVYHDSVAFSSSIPDVKLLESSTSSYLVVESSSGYHHL